MHIAIDARAISHPQPGGFKSYTTNLARALLELDQTNCYTLYFDRPLDVHLWQHYGNASRQVVAGAAGWLAMPIREQILLAQRIRAERPDVVHFPCATGTLLANCPTVITIHDAIAFLDESRMATLTGENIRRVLMSHYIRWVQLLAAKRAKIVITDSLYSQRDIAQVLKIDSAKIRVIPLAQAPHFSLQNDQIQLDDLRRRYHLPQAFVLALVSASPRKNAAGLLRIYARLPIHLRDQFPLVMVWTHNLFQNEIETMVRQLELQGSVLSIQRVPDQDLALLYNAASVFVFPSLYEGFGLPVLEAMSCGAPVLSSNRTSLPEVAGSAALLVDPADEPGFADRLASLLTDTQMRMDLSELGQKHAAQFSWHRTAQMTLSAYHEARLL